MKNTFLIGCFLIQLFLFGCNSITNASDLVQQKRISESPQWNGKTFQNPDQVPESEVGASTKIFWNYFFNKLEGATPDKLLPAVPFDRSEWDGKRDLQFAWLGIPLSLLRLITKSS